MACEPDLDFLVLVSGVVAEDGMALKGGDKTAACLQLNMYLTELPDADDREMILFYIEQF